MKKLIKRVITEDTENKKELTIKGDSLEQRVKMINRINEKRSARGADLLEIPEV